MAPKESIVKLLQALQNFSSSRLFAQNMKQILPSLKNLTVVINSTHEQVIKKLSHWKLSYSMEEEESSRVKPKFWYPRAVTYDALKAGSIDGTDVEPHDRAIVRALDARYKPNHKVKGIPENTIFISRLNRKTSERTLKHEFSRFGSIVRCRLVRDLITNFSLGYAFIEYENEQDAHAAVHRADRMAIDDRNVFVDFECERLLPGWIPRRLGGGFGGRKESGQLRFGGKEKPFAKPIQLMSEEEIRVQLKRKKSNLPAYMDR